jgi:hypothetical protein
MNEKDNKQLVNKPSEAIEDLTVNEAEAGDVKGGPSYLKVKDIDGIVTDERPNPGVRTDYNPYITVDWVEEVRK